MTKIKKNIKSNIDSPESIQAAVLKTIPYAYTHRRDIDIEIQAPEHTSVCPMTGLPDFGCITISYRPRDAIVELKSLKYYLMQYRHVGIFYEHLVNRILDDLVSVLNPKRMEVVGAFSPRGGITTRVSAVFEE